MEGPAVDWIAYFETMKDWKRLPAYKAEPRLDSLVAIRPGAMRGWAGD